MCPPAGVKGLLSCPALWLGSEVQRPPGAAESPHWSAEAAGARGGDARAELSGNQ